MFKLDREEAGSTVTAQKSVVLALLMKLPINFQKVLLSQYRVY